LPISAKEERRKLRMSMRLQHWLALNASGFRADGLLLQSALRKKRLLAARSQSRAFYPS
jgi:hypothetical protein